MRPSERLQGQFRGRKVKTVSGDRRPFCGREMTVATASVDGYDRSSSTDRSKTVV